jgi:formate hydrogenlyase subunit 3/multisubunit Na+/H+ antiporter MnhD subunit
MWEAVESTYLLVLFVGTAAALSSRLLPRRAASAVSTAISAAALALLLTMSLQAGGLAGYIGFVSTVIGLAAVAAAIDIVHEDKALHNALVLALSGSLAVLAGSGDLIRIFIAWELMSVSVLILVAFHRDREAAEAALKYLMLCGVGSALALVGIALVALETGSTAVGAVQRASMLARALLAVGFATEAALFPLHFWLPDAHMVAPSTASAMLSGIVIEAAAVLAWRVAGADPVTSRVFLLLAAAGALLGNLSALAQDDFKRLLAYSSVANVSYVLMGLCSGSELARTYAYLHIAAHGFLKAALFLTSGVLLAVHGTRSLAALRGSAARDNLLKLVVIASCLGLTGAPPLLPFWSELFLAVGLFGASPPLALAFIVAVVISFGYYFRVLYSLSVGAPSGSSQKALTTAKLAALSLVLLSAALFLQPRTLLAFFSLA